MSYLVHYTARALEMTTGELIYALADVATTLKYYKDSDPCEGYAEKLWAEWDAYSVELYNRRKPK